MEYIICFLEGIISFISPCMLPMLPVYISYFAGEQDSNGRTVSRALAFMLGFTLIFTALGLFAGVLGSFLLRYKRLLDIVCGIIVIIFGLSFMDVIHLPFFKGMGAGRKVSGIFSAFIFGMIYSLNLTPCVGAFLGSALMLAGTAGSAVKGGVMLLFYSLGLGVPFVLSAVLIGRLGSIFGFIKRHYRVINIVCGAFLIIIGLMMCFGLMNLVMATFS